MNYERGVYLAVVGTMGVGKSTAAEVLANRLNFQLFPEQFTDNPYLQDYYRDPSKFAFLSQTHFLLDIIDQTRRISHRNSGISAVQDCYRGQYVYSYARTQKELNYMNESSWKQYLDIDKSLADGLEEPDLLVHLQASLPVLIQRIGIRRRSFEKPITEEYVKLLDDTLSEWIRTQDIFVLTLTTDTYDIAQDPEAQEDFVENVRAALRIVQKNKGNML